MRRRGAALALGLLGLALLAWLALPLAFLLSFRSDLVGTPADVGLAFERIELAVPPPTLRLVAWWMPASQPKGVVILLHDGHSNRSFLWSNGLALARALHEAGYHVLAPDLAGHGESGDAASVPVGRGLAADVSAWPASCASQRSCRRGTCGSSSFVMSSSRPESAATTSTARLSSKAMPYRCSAVQSAERTRGRGKPVALGIETRTLLLRSAQVESATTARMRGSRAPA